MQQKSCWVRVYQLGKDLNMSDLTTSTVHYRIPAHFNSGLHTSDSGLILRASQGVYLEEFLGVKYGIAIKP